MVMPKISDKFVIIHEDYFRATGDDFVCAAILNLIESIAKKQSCRPDGWAEITVAFIMERLFGIASERSIHRKIDTLKKLGIVESQSKQGNVPSYRINFHQIEYISKRRMSAFRDENPANEQYQSTPDPCQIGTPDPCQVGTPYPCQIGTPPLPNWHPPYIYSIDSIAKASEQPEQPLVPEQSFPPSREKDLRTTEEAQRTKRTTNTKHAIVVDKKVSIKIEKAEPTTGDGENPMNESVRAILKSYDRIPKAKRDRYCLGSLSAMYKTHGDAIERITEQYGEDEVLEALELFKADEYWQGRGFPIRAFISQIEKYTKNESPTQRGYGTTNQASAIEPCPVTASIPAIAAEAPKPLFDSPDREMRAKKRRRIDDVLFMVRVATPERVDELNKLMVDLDSVEPSVIEYWFTDSLSHWKEKHGGFEPSLRSKALC